jgi:hypothetical protein
MLQQAREGNMEELYIELYAAIVKQAMTDYKAALKDDGKKALKKRRECEKFFLSAYGQMLSAGNGERIINQCKAEVEAEEQKKE